ncbi:phospholipid carrier-dependent glycosyltransferase [Anaerolineae bacterium CFX9]|nr:phospholipid carrier-dependent glycosyltransferase [Anaerolineae bacterium CFX9]
MPLLPEKQSRSRLLQAALLLICILYILAGTSLAPFHGDESTQITMSRDYAYLFIERDLSRISFNGANVTAWEQDLRLLNGTVSKNLIGLMWHLAGFSRADLNEQWDWGADWDYNTANNHKPGDALLQLARLPSAVMLALGAVVIFALGRWISGTPAAMMATVYYTLNPALLLNGRRAMMEGGLILFSLLALFAGVWWLRAVTKGDRRASIAAAALLGISAGLALAAKHSAIFGVMAIFAGCGVWLVIRERTRLMDGLIHLIGAGVGLMIVFYALNPAWWGDPLGRIPEVLTRRSDLLAGQTAAFGGYSDAGAALDGFFRQAFIVPPQYFEVSGWDAWIGDEIAAYEASPWAGISIGGTLIGGIAMLALTAAGFIALVRSRSAPAAARWLIGFWSAAILISTLALTPLEWQRYYLLVYPAIGLLASAGVYTIGSALHSRSRYRSHKPHPEAGHGEETLSENHP